MDTNITGFREGTLMRERPVGIAERYGEREVKPPPLVD